MRAALGGTFNVLHDGHKVLIDKAFSEADEILIGLTSDKMASSSRDRIVPYSIRKKGLEEYLSGKDGKWEILEIADMFGPAVDIDMDLLVVSEETYENGVLVNEERIRRNMRPVSLIVVGMERNEGERISARNILSGKCSRSGSRTAMDIAVGSSNPVKAEAVRTVMEKIFGDVRITALKVDPGVPEQPWGDETLCGAVNRAKAAIGDRDMSVGIEAGVFEMYDGVYDIQHCVVLDRDGKMTIGMGPGFRYPDDVAELLRKGMTVGDAMKSLYPNHSGRGEGAIGILSKGLLDRKSLTEQAVMAAMITRTAER